MQRMIVDLFLLAGLSLIRLFVSVKRKDLIQIINYELRIKM